MFPGSSVGKESTCYAGDPSSILGLGRSTGEGLSYSLQCSWASLVAPLVKNPPAMRETWVWSLGWEDTLEKGKATHSGILAWRIPWTVCIVHGVAKSRTRLSDFRFHPCSPLSSITIISATTITFSALSPIMSFAFTWQMFVKIGIALGTMGNKL